MSATPFEGAPEVSFDFIRDSELRQSLRSDYAELAACLAAGAWKAAHVLSGSIIEAMLADFLISVKYKTRDPLRMSLTDLIDACTKQGALTTKTSELSGAIRSYRNLIHPGRAKRLNEVADQDGARIVAALVGIIVREVSAKQEEEFGLTAEQLLQKFEDDPLAFGIAAHLLKEARPEEVERLLLRVLPDRYFYLLQATGFDFGDDDFDYAAALQALEKLYREAFDAAADETKAKAIKRFAAVLREETGTKVQAYEDKFFRASDLSYATDRDRRLIKDHFFSRTKDKPLSLDHIACYDGLAGQIAAGEVPKFADPLIRTIAYGPAEAQKAAAECLEAEFLWYLPTTMESRVLKRFDDWIDLFENQRPDPETASRLRQLRDKLGPKPDDDIPF